MEPQHDLERIRFVTGHFNELKGLQGRVPGGLFILGTALGTSVSGSFGWTTGAVLSGFLATAAVAAGALCFSLRAGAYYRRTYGDVERSRTSVLASYLSGPALRSMAVMGAVVILGMALMVFGQLMFRGGRFFYLVTGLSLLKAWFSNRRPMSQGYYPVLGVLLLGLAVPNPTAAILAPWPHLARALFLCGAVDIFVGLLDHRQLVRTLKPVENPELVAATEEEGQ